MTGISAAKHNGRTIAQSDTLELSIPECDKGLGKVIGAIDSSGLIAGVRLDRLLVHPDDRGYFLELQLIGRGLAAEFPAASSQISAALSSFSIPIAPCVSTLISWPSAFAVFSSFYASM